jgi:hypothetical protein
MDQPLMHTAINEHGRKLLYTVKNITGDPLQAVDFET